MNNTMPDEKIYAIQINKGYIASSHRTENTDFEVGVYITYQINGLGEIRHKHDGTKSHIKYAVTLKDKLKLINRILWMR